MASSLRIVIPAAAALITVVGLLAGAAEKGPATPAKESPPASAGLALAGMAQGKSTPPAPAPAPAAAVPELLPAENHELAAISIIGEHKTALISDVEEKQARWIGVGEKFGNLELVSVDGQKNVAIVKVDGATRLLHLRKSTIGVGDAAPIAVVSGSMAAVPEPGAAAPQPPAAPATEEEFQAREARMFVADLLEIGIQQRRAYEQQQADAGKAPAAPAPAPAQ